MTTSNWVPPNWRSPRRSCAIPERAAGCRQAQYWAGEYRKHEAGGDTLNLYDVSALAHADLIRAARADRRVPVDVKALKSDLAAQLEIGVKRAASDPFGAGAQYDNFDAVPHAFGLAATARLYRKVTGDRRYDTFGARPAELDLRREPLGRLLHGRRRRERGSLPAPPDRATSSDRPGRSARSSTARTPPTCSRKASATTSTT